MKSIEIIKERRKECLEHIKYLESKLGDKKYFKENYIDDNDLEKEIEEFNIRFLECEVLFKKIKGEKE